MTPAVPRPAGSLLSSLVNPIPPPEALRVPDRWVVPVMLSIGLLAWSARFIWRTSFVVEGQRIFCLFDDAMISMVYARNLAEGYGLNWARQGAPVEGFTHPLWLLLMIPLHWLPIARVHASLGVQVLSALVLVLNLWMVRRLVLRHFSTPRQRAWWPAAVLTATYYPLNHWALQGMETGLQALLVTTILCFSLDYVDGRARPLPLFVVSSLALLLRMDMAIAVVPTLLYALVRGRPSPEHRRSWWAGWALLLGSAGAYELFRWWYFGQLLPNTYYLKMTGVAASVRILRGLLVFADFAAPLALPLIALAVALLPLLPRSPKLILPAAIAVLGFAYSIYVGGDGWEWSTVGANRFVAWTVPLLFVLVNALLNLGLEARSGAPRVRPHLWDLYWRVAVTLVCALSFNGLWLSKDAEAHRENFMVATRPLHIAENAKVVRQMAWAEKMLKPGAVVATMWAGIPAYFGDHRMVDLYGYNDAYVAALPARVPLGLDNAREFVPGHVKWDYDHSLGRLRPDFVFQAWGPRQDELARVMEKYGYRPHEWSWVRSNSDQILAAP